MMSFALIAGLTYTEALPMTPGMICDLYIYRRRYDDEQHRLKRE